MVSLQVLSLYATEFGLALVWNLHSAPGAHKTQICCRYQNWAVRRAIRAQLASPVIK